jgi:hypothetical protein
MRTVGTSAAIVVLVELVVILVEIGVVIAAPY